MSIIQKIRDKAAWLVFGLIAVSLIGFLLMDARSIGGRAGGSTSGSLVLLMEKNWIFPNIRNRFQKARISIKVRVIR